MRGRGQARSHATARCPAYVRRVAQSPACRCPHQADHGLECASLVRENVILFGTSRSGNTIRLLAPSPGDSARTQESDLASRRGLGEFENRRIHVMIRDGGPETLEHHGGHGGMHLEGDGPQEEPVEHPHADAAPRLVPTRWLAAFGLEPLQVGGKELALGLPSVARRSARNRGDSRRPCTTARAARAASRPGTGVRPRRGTGCRRGRRRAAGTADRPPPGPGEATRSAP